MKILLISKNLHHKNLNALFKYDIDIDIYDGNSCDLQDYDMVYSPDRPVNVSNFPNTKFIFGPHFSVFPIKEDMDMIRGSNTTYIQPSLWAANVWKKHEACNGINIKSVPFGVDTAKFCEIKPLSERKEVFVYYKRRNTSELLFVLNYLQQRGYNPRLFNYVQGYNENDYLMCLQNAKFGVWVGAHESQGFALEEALSCNVPLIVWNVKSMNQECGSNYEDIMATTIPYWDNTCGEYFYMENDFDLTYKTFIDKINEYSPRKFIIENISIEKCSQMFKYINNINMLNVI